MGNIYIGYLKMFIQILGIHFSLENKKKMPIRLKTHNKFHGIPFTQNNCLKFYLWSHLKQLVHAAANPDEETLHAFDLGSPIDRYSKE